MAENFTEEYKTGIGKGVLALEKWLCWKVLCALTLLFSLSRPSYPAFIAPLTITSCVYVCDRSIKCPALSSGWSVRLSSVWSAHLLKNLTRMLNMMKTRQERKSLRSSIRSLSTTRCSKACLWPLAAKSSEIQCQRWRVIAHAIFYHFYIHVSCQ